MIKWAQLFIMTTHLPFFFIMSSPQIPDHLRSQAWISELWSDAQKYYTLLAPHLPSQKLQIVDVGANIGCTSIFFALQFDAKILAIEAIAQTYAQLKKNCALYPNIETEHQAVAEKESKGRFYRYPLAPGLGGFEEDGFPFLKRLGRAGQKDISNIFLRILWYLFSILIVLTRYRVDVDMMPLSKILHNKNFEGNIDVLKIDIEGHELEALRGINTSDWERIGLIVLEVHVENREEVGSILENVGFVVVYEERESSKGEGFPTLVVAKSKEE